MGLNLNAMIGLLGGALLFVTAIFLTAKTPLIYLNVHGAMIVVGGTLLAAMLSYSFKQLSSAFRRAGHLFRSEKLIGKDDIELFIRVAAYRQGGKSLAIEEETKKTNSPFIRTGLQMLSDGMPPDDIVNVLEMRMKHQEALERSDAGVFKMMATYTPAFGLAATLIGLVNMLFLMGQGATAQQVGMNMSLALVATFYGVVLANALLRPIAAKIEMKTQDRMRVMATFVEAIHAIALGRGPSHIREILYAVVATYSDDVGLQDTLATMSEKDLYAGKE